MTRRPAHPRDRRRRPVPPPRRHGRRRRRAGRPDGRGGAGRRRRRRARRRAAAGRLDPRRQPAVVALRQPGVGPRPSASASTPRELAYTTAGGNTPQALVNRTAARHRRRPRRPRRPRRRRGVADADAGPASGNASSTGPRRPTTPPPVTLGDELDMTHPGRGRPRHLPAGAGVPDVRDGDPGRRRARRPTSTSPRSPSCGRASAPSPPPTRTPGRATAMTPRRSPRSRRSNRIIGLPYRKVMNSNNDVDMAAAIIMCSVERGRGARRSPRDRWVFPHAGTDCHEHPYVSNRWSFADTPAIRIGGRRALELAGVGIDDIAIVDLYSCFPSAVQPRRGVARARPRRASSPAPAG